MPGKEKQIIRIVKKKKGHAAHHGGSWKVAYADFVTAMMAFFMVMWLLSMDQKMKDAIEGYFSNPVGFKKGFSAGTNIISSGNSPAGEVKPPLRILIRRAEEKKFGDLAKDLRSRLNGSPDLRALGAHIETVRTKSGLRIELIESGSGQTFFRNGSAEPLPITVAALRLIGAELSRLQTPIIIEGHTDSQQFGSSASYTNWELSSDRANAARRLVQEAGVDPSRIVEVRGMADRDLRVPSNPMDPANRRISILLPFTVLPGEPDPAEPLSGDAEIVKRSS
ncbi:MAG TPA: flagellar motor protein MotB [Gemmatimonadaceae bacterium]|nr:flagellar motor protein MotB [Gemmatimonadaceae bacterium]